MKNRFLKLIFLNIVIFIGIMSVNAGSVSITGSQSVYVNSTVTVTVKFNNVAGKFSIASSDQSVLAGGQSDFYDNETKTFIFEAKSTGTATITVTPIGVVGDYDTEEYTGGSRSLTINVIKKSTPPSINVNPTYSTNNYLKSLSISGYAIDPGFDKETLEYIVELNPGSEKVNIEAVAEHKSAKIKGIGEVSVTEGVNTFEIVVTAENGNERTYKITANVEEKDPIEIKIGDEYYRLIKKKEILGTKEGYTEKTVNIKGFEIPTLYNEVVDVTLVGLKDTEGNIKLFSYDTKNGEYEEYLEFNFDLMSLYVHETNNDKYEKINIKIGKVDVPAYKIDALKDYYLLYATNTTTGNEGYYLYDKVENSVQRYNSTLVDNLTNQKDKYLALVLVLSSVCFLTMLFLLIQVNKENKKA